jgi:hypothetical protein
MRENEKSRRLRERLAISMPVRVTCRETADREWVEMTRLVDVTPFGARVTISHPTEPGRLLHMTLAMPRQLRCFDHVEDQYRVWTLVRNIKTLPPVDDKPSRFEVGVAFIGKRAPQSFTTDPTKRYDVAPSPTGGLWGLREYHEGAATHIHSEGPRPDTRHNMPLDVVVEVFGEGGSIAATERTVTENISRTGAAVFTTLNLEPGRFVRLTSTQYNLSVLAAVRAIRKGPNGVPRLHLEFVDRPWPLGDE